MRRWLVQIVLLTVAGSASAGSYAGGSGPALSLVCSDSATKTFPVAFSGAGCAFDGAEGTAARKGGVRICRTDAGAGEVLSVSPDLTFSLQNLRTNGVLDGWCVRG